MTSGTDAARLVAILGRLRRRSLVALSVRYVCASTVAAVLVAEVVLLASPTEPGPTTLFAGVALAAAGAGVIAWFTGPTIRETAHATDRRLHLQDRLVTAFQYRAATDAFSCLVVQDALSRVDDLRPASAFPFHVPRWTRVAGAVACAAPLVVVLAMGVPEFWERVSRGRSSGPAALTIPASAGGRGGTPAGVEADAAIAKGATRVQVAEAAVPEPPRTGDSSEAQDRARGDVGPSPVRAPGSAVDNTGAGVTTGAGSAPRRTERRLQQAPSESGGAARGDGSAGLPQIQQAGGLTGTPALGVSDVARAERAADPTREAVYRSAWSESQRAIAQERIPSALRDYVRQYFVAIRPAEAK